ncbi:MAG: DUF5518 domain-containing protein [Methanobacteriaceae archaeon]|jgi:hypothetical protein|nr:DUF5518 domain-containing protein [Methanobacteriaceae archaeon]MDO9626016.1 DUF5518 domain-containing protein [Methanobacteriaceae archaeon]
MASIAVVVEGFILAIIFTVVLAILGIGSVMGLPVALFGFLIAGIIVGYISYGDIFDGMINGALMGVAGAIILWLLSLFKGQIAAFSAQLSNYVPLNTPPEIILVIAVGAIGAVVGSLISRFNHRNRRYRNGDEDSDERNQRNQDYSNKKWRD